MSDQSTLHEHLQQAMRQHQAGDLLAAERSYQQVLALDPQHLQALRLSGILARETGAIAQSLERLHTAAAQPGAGAQPLAELALTHIASGDLQAAQHCLREARQRAPNSLDVLTNLGALLQHRGHVVEAIAIYREVLAQDPDAIEVHGNLVKALADAGEVGTAIAAAERAVERTGATRGTLAALGAVLVDAERYAAAASVLRRATAADPGDDMSRVNLALCEAALAHHDSAVTALREAVQVNPHNARAVADLINALSRADAHTAALQLGQDFLQEHPAERLVLGSYALALRNAGDAAAADDLTDTANLVQVVDLAWPAEFESLQAFNQSLQQHILSDESLLAEPLSKSTTGGSQTGELELDASAALRGFAAGADAAVDRVAATYRALGLHDHPVLQPASPHWHLRCWGTVLTAGGQQSPHMHPLGWLSAVYYVGVPEQMAAEPATSAGATAGWLEFGRPPDRLHVVTPPPVRRIAPRPGRLVVFPSWFWHRTLPFSASGQRFSMAFDVMPAGQLSAL